MSAPHARRALETWVGALASGGVLATPDADAEPDARAGHALAAFVVGEPALAELRAFLASADESTAVRERCAAVEICIWMAHADRQLHAEERRMLENLVAASRLAPAERQELLSAIDEPPPLDGIEVRLTHPVLRELILALAWELALSDGRVDTQEETLFLRLASQLDVELDRAQELREAMDQRVG